MNAISQTSSTTDAAIFRKVTWRLMPLLLACYVIAYVDRVGIGFAKIKMMADLGFDAAIYGMGAGIFFIGFVVFEVPSNLILHRVGARMWIARIMVTWGIISMLMMTASSPIYFYALRFLLGAAEAGFLPGAIYYLTGWYPQERRGQVFSILIMGTCIGGLVAGPTSGWIMWAFEGVAGLHNWQWLFVLQGIPAVLLGFCVYFLLPDRFETADWLSVYERNRLQHLLEQDKTADAKPGQGGVLWGRLVRLGLVMAAINLGIYIGVFWLPTMLTDAGVRSYGMIGVLSALPYAGAMIVMLGLGRSSDKLKERRLHVAGATVLAAAGLGLAAAQATQFSAILSLMAASAILMGVTPLMWALVSGLMSGRSAAIALALLNIFGALGGFFGPLLMGLAERLTGTTAMTLKFATVLMFIAALIIFGSKDQQRWQDP